MVSVQMYWGQTSWSWPGGLTTNYGPNGIEVSGVVSQLQYSMYYLVEKTATLRILGQFFLNTGRMPSEGCVFTSLPIVMLSGDIKVTTSAGTWFWDSRDPTLTTVLQARQLVYSGGQLVKTSYNVLRLAELDLPYSTDRFFMPSLYAPAPVSFTLDRNRELEIDIELKIVMEFRGWGTAAFSNENDSQPFLIRLPQWSITSPD